MGRAVGPTLLESLDDMLLLGLERVPPEVRRMVEYLISGHAAARLLGLDAIQGQLLHRGQAAEGAHHALPYLLALAQAPAYPHAAAVLARVGSVLETLDDPPRSLAREAASEARGSTSPTGRVVAMLEAHIPALLRVAKRSRDPEAARAAARIAAHFPSADAELGPLLLALLTGARDDHGRAQLLHALARIQAEAGAALHPRLERALADPQPTVDKAAVALALADYALDPPSRDRVRAALEQLVAAAPDAATWPDPRAWGGRYVPAAAKEALARLAATGAQTPR